ncbi:MAG: protein kinase [Cyanobacteria bacterium SBC]|nr:protein kinase [Cyanobacteria bacterium SBC]
MVAPLLNNRYLVLATLRTGGFGQTYLAEDTHLPSRRRCVIKQLQLVTPSPDRSRTKGQGDASPTDVCARFAREAAVLETLGDAHAQIPRLYAYFSEGGQFYLVQEWIDGETLLDRVRQLGTWDDRAVTKLLTQILPVLDFIHGRGIVHRDVKPDNIVLRRTDGLPVLIDFGAVKEAVNAPDNAPQSSIVIGTPGFMASEQAAGRPTFTSDLYSLGLTAIYLLSGKFPQDIPIDPKTGELLWREVLPSVGGRLATTIDRSIRFHPRDRFSSAAEMLAALAPAAEMSSLKTVAVAPAAPSQMATRLQPKKTRRQSPPPLEKRPGFKSRNPRRFPFVGLATVAVAIGGLTLGWQAMQPSLQDRGDRPSKEQPTSTIDESDRRGGASPSFTPPPMPEPVVRDRPEPERDAVSEEKKIPISLEPEPTPPPTPEPTPTPEPDLEPTPAPDPVEPEPDDSAPTADLEPVDSIEPEPSNSPPLEEPEPSIEPLEKPPMFEPKFDPEAKVEVLDWGEEPEEKTP